MGVNVVERVQRQLVVDLSDLDEEQQGWLKDGVDNLLRQVIAGDIAEVVGWTSEALEEAFARLERDGAHVQVATIQEALRQNGYVTRDRVYKIGRYSKGRSLRGFTRPVNRIVADLKAEGRIPESAANLLSSSYQNGAVADGFSVDARLSTLLG
ncbi:hypothetical protein IGS73_15025 [Janibacter indicus]|uniref:Uncharacterized protein n=1 Tax=Janibacter indicus TaxID=857417 RepID=A0A7L9IZ22_9MICO|nr:hypothetical protein [Janibacter indicus]QOK22379.1 hypothetical protein IGS73_15025 [Janibacter indicus]